MLSSINSTIRLFSGDLFNFLDPKENKIHIEDIAHSLARLCRFTGHTKDFYSVAQHSVLVSYLVPAEFQRHGLLHDAAEAYLGDVARPLKMLLPDYLKIERKVESVVFRRFNLPENLPKEVSDADHLALEIEYNTVGTGAGIRPLLPKKAENLFLNRYKALFSI